MENRTVLIVVALVLAYFIFVRRPGPVKASGTLPGGAPKPISPSPAMPNVSTSQQLTALAIQSAPSVIKSLGSFFSSDSGGAGGGGGGGDYGDYSYSDSSSFSEDSYVGDEGY